MQAAVEHADVIIDDPWGRALAERFGRNFHGTVWTLRRFFELGLATAAMTSGYFVELLNRGFRLPWKAVNEFLVEIGETPLTETDRRA